MKTTMLLVCFALSLLYVTSTYAQPSQAPEPPQAPILVPGSLEDDMVRSALVSLTTTTRTTLAPRRSITPTRIAYMKSIPRPTSTPITLTQPITYQSTMFQSTTPQPTTFHHVTGIGISPMLGGIGSVCGPMGCGPAPSMGGGFMPSMGMGGFGGGYSGFSPMSFGGYSGGYGRGMGGGMMGGFRGGFGGGCGPGGCR